MTLTTVSDLAKFLVHGTCLRPINQDAVLVAGLSVALLGQMTKTSNKVIHLTSVQSTVATF